MLKKLEASINRMIKEYDFLDLSKREIYEYIKDTLKLEEDIDLTDFEGRVRHILNNYIKEQLQLDSFSIIERYINKKFTGDNLSNLEKLCLFIENIGYLIDENFFFSLINQNDTLHQCIQSIPVSNIENSTDNNMVISMVKTYHNPYLEITTIEHYLNEYEKDLDIVKLYQNEINQPLLTAEEEIELFQRIELGDKEARKIVIERNLRLVFSIAIRRITNKSMDFLDFVQDGNIGLIKAADSFDLSRKCKFSTYAYPKINGEIIRGYREMSRTISLPYGKYDELRAYHKVRKNLVQNRKSTFDDIIRFNKIEKEKTKKPYLYYDAISLDSLLDSTNALERYLSSYDINYEEKVILKEDIKKMLISSNLLDIEKRILILRYGLENNYPHQQEEIAKTLRLALSNERWIEKRSIEKIKNCHFRRN